MSEEDRLYSSTQRDFGDSHIKRLDDLNRGDLVSVHFMDSEGSDPLVFVSINQRQRLKFVKPGSLSKYESRELTIPASDVGVAPVIVVKKTGEERFWHTKNWLERIIK